MGRTIRDTVVHGQPLDRVRNEVMAWFSSHGIRVLDTSPSSVRGRSVPWYMWGPLSVLGGAGNYFEISFKQDRSSVVVHAEGYVKSLASEQDFSPDAVMGGLPRRRGWNAIQDLWNRLAYMSPGSAREGGLSCGSCGSPVLEGARFCGKCGMSMIPSEARLAQPQGQPAVVAPVRPRPPAQSCGNCGVTIREGDRFCRNCGKSNVPAEVPAITLPQSYQPSSVTPTPVVRPQYCGTCGAQVQERHRYCPSCGKQIT